VSAAALPAQFAPNVGRTLSVFGATRRSNMTPLASFCFSETTNGADYGTAVNGLIRFGMWTLHGAAILLSYANDVL